MNDNMTKEQEAQYIAALQREAVKFGLDPNNYDHLEATEKTLREMEAFRIDSADTDADSERKMQEKLRLAKHLNMDVSGYHQSMTQIGEELVAAQKKTNTREMIAMAASAILGVVAAVFVHRHANRNDWGTAKKVFADIGAFIGAGAGAGYLSFLAVAKPALKKLDEISAQSGTRMLQFDEQLFTRMAQQFAKEIEAEHAQAAAKQQQSHPAQAVTDHTTTQAHPGAAAPAPAKTEAEIIADAKNKEEIAKEVREAAEVTYESGKHVDGLAPTNLMDRVAQPGASHADTAAEQKKVAATQQHTMV